MLSGSNSGRPQTIYAVAHLDNFDDGASSTSSNHSSIVTPDSINDYIDNNNNQNDSIEQFERDLTTVLKVLRRDDEDPEVPALFRSRRLSLTYSWNLEDWEQHSTRFRFVHYLRTLPSSRLLRRTAPQMTAFCVVAALASIITPPGVLSRAVVPLTSLSLVSTFVGALLTLRSNTGLSRLTEGRVAWGNVVLNTREIGQIIATKIYPNNSQLALLLARHTSLFGWTLKAQLRGRQNDVEEVVRTMIPQVDADYILNQRKLPVAVLAKLRQGIQHVASTRQITSTEEMSLEKCVRELDHAIMTTGN